ncbi:MAG: hypothetical protein GOV01_01905 [Candidatus Altiarchaeota archaeon]|nr:hypothetical protein [Candidatus Altiarchaeota archaeon]
MTLRVTFHKQEPKQFFDVSSADLTFPSEFMGELMDAVKKRKNYHADIAGIDEVYMTSGRVDNAPFFLIEFDRKSGKYEFLFKILSGENTLLIGVIPKVEDETRLRYLLNLTANKTSENVRLLI